jgi:hypothetical protein
MSHLAPPRGRVGRGAEVVEVGGHGDHVHGACTERERGGRKVRRRRPKSAHSWAAPKTAHPSDFHPCGFVGKLLSTAFR